MSETFGDLQYIRFKVTGESALLMNSPAKMKIPSRGISTKRIPLPDEEAESGCYRLPSGQLYLPSTHFYGTILLGASGQKIGKKAAAQIIAAGLFQVEECFPLYDPENGKPIKDYEIDTRRAVVQRAAVMRSRPKVPKWETIVSFQYEPLLLCEETIFSTLALAGRVVGVGDYRPAKKGPFGRFSVELIKN
jgi:hypothetical protein